jgi:hypothetical protein
VSVCADAEKKQSKDEAKKAKRGKRGWVDEPVKLFRVREPAGQRSDMSSPAQRELHVMFGATLPAAVIDDVFQTAGPAAEPCIEALLMLVDGAMAPLNSQGTGGSSTSTPSASDMAWQGHASRSSPAGAVRSSAPRSSRSIGPNHWDELPDDCKLLIINMLAPRELATFAQVSKNMAAFAAHRRAAVTVLRAKGPVSELHHCIAVHTNASKVRYERHLYRSAYRRR